MSAPSIAHRLAYLLPSDPGVDSGVWKKIQDQVGAWRDSGRDVRIFMLSKSPARLSGSAPELSVVPYSSRFSKINSLRRLSEEVLDWHPDVIYHRYALAFRPFVRLAKSRPLVLELNSNDLTEYRSKGVLQDRYNRLTRARLLRQCRAVVIVSGDLRDIVSPWVQAEAITTIGNSIDLSRIAECPSPRMESGIRGVFLASRLEAPWQALDKVLFMARAFSDWQFDLVGVTAHDIRELPPNVRCHGKLAYEQYRPLLCAANFAIGTLGLHRKGMNEASPLKVREYLAHGIPTITGNRDADFPDGAPFLLMLENKEENVAQGLPLISDFVGRTASVRVERHAIGHLDAAVKEAKRLRFIDSALTDGR